MTNDWRLTTEELRQELRAARLLAQKWHRRWEEDRTDDVSDGRMHDWIACKQIMEGWPVYGK